MNEFTDPIAEKYIEMKEDERIREEGRKSGYDIYSMNAETVRICRENEKKTPRPIIGKFSDHVKKYY